MPQLLGRDASHARRIVLASSGLHFSSFERGEELDIESRLLVVKGVLRDRRDMIAGEPLLEARCDQALRDALLPWREPKRTDDGRISCPR